MLVKANKTYAVVKDAKINDEKGGIVKGARLKTLTSPLMKQGAERVMVEYSGASGASGEARNGTKFWLRVSDIAELCREE